MRSSTRANIQECLKTLSSNMNLRFFTAKENIEQDAQFIEHLKASFRCYQKDEYNELIGCVGQASGNRLYDLYANIGEFVVKDEYEAFYELFSEMVDRPPFVKALREEIQCLLKNERDET